MNEPIAEREALWSQFLERWPLESLHQMTLEQYNLAGSDDHFCRWLEKHTESLGSIWGGSSFKFGVFSRLDKKEKSNPHRVFTDEHAWLKKYGSSAEQAFSAVRQHIVTVAEAAHAGDLETIEQVDLGPVVKWKIAFLYQNRQDPSILCVYAARDLCAAVGRKASHNEQLAPLQRQLMAQRQGQNLFAYSDQLWAQAQEWHRKHSLTEQALDFFSADPERFTEINVTKKMAGFRLSNDRELALLRENGKLSLFVAPGNWRQAIAGLDCEPYSPQGTRHSGLASCAPALAVGNPALSIKLVDMAALEAFCLAYETDSMDEVTAVQSLTPGGERQVAPLNQILYGPPGTGKTYETIDTALEVLAPQLLSLPREQRKRHFDEFVAQKRIRFVTFHQSFSYEDFVEGLRALPPNSEGNPGGALAYDVAKGVFVQLCLDASGDPVLEQQLGLKKDPTIWKISIEEASSDGRTRRYCFQHGEARIGWHKVGDIRQADLADPSLKLGSNDQSSLASFGSEIEEGDVLVCLGTRKSICAVGVVTGEYEYNPEVPEGVRKDYVHRLPVNWLLTDIDFDITELNGGRGLTLKTLYPMSRISWPELQRGLQQADLSLVGEAKRPMVGPKLPHVLIIDEINRGNISRIFGELITLIEPSKRAGASEALEAVLPYSKRHFSVPDNVYLIGTMNTADRSLAGLDIALRRRFVFREMPPRPELLDAVEVQGLNIGKLLRVMNQRIEVLLDRDHCLGHAYFMPLKGDPTLARLESIFRNQILPLLQEYFFEDWQRIQWVFNDHRKPVVDRFVEQDKQDVAALFGNISVPAQGGVWRINDAAFKRFSAYAGVIAVNAKAEVPAEELEEASA
ncbi:AAA family ATPase [Pseudomonas aeruginosa]|uniref:AAA family ATPase n=1 Tax=Pseudomonas aeruginosa TaxID=287 RepID=UPI001F26D107|nr:AAA family ATPase [Pseudomonas aeruginosa]MDU0606269.1 AAA family ATPase [Pseudomonas aeruginosa]